MLKIFDDKIKLSIAFCEELLKIVNEKDKINLALSGGSTPKLIYQTLAEKYKEKIDWNKIRLFWGDERCVPPDDEESNYGMTKKYLLDHINIPEENIHRIKGENDPEHEANRYSKEIEKAISTVNGFPNFDLVMLGIGEDGHTASIFPDQMKLIDSKKICNVSVHPSSKQKRITLTGNVINNSDKVIFLATGKSKADIIKKILEEKKLIYPAEYIKPVRGELMYFIDADASLLLNLN